MGFKKTSGIVAVSFGIEEAVVDTAVEEQVALQLDILNQEIFVVLAIDLDPQAPSQVNGVSTQTQMSLCSSTQTEPQLLSNTNCLAEERLNIHSDAANVGTGAVFRQSNGSTPPATMDYIGIIATNDFFVQLKGNNNTSTRSGTGRLWGYRAKADSATYAALVQSEVLSA